MTEVKVHRNDISGVFTTKKGLHEFLTIEIKYFLPPIQYTNMDWLSDIWQGKRKVIASLHHSTLAIIGLEM
jgi:hypothetical protein